jgi:hypothetical protein
MSEVKQLITSKLEHILQTAEERYGARDYSYTILRIEFTQEEQPQIYYPRDKQIIIQITQNCITDIDYAVYQVAHEAIHCLSPMGKKAANVLEEGLATLFSIEYTRENGNNDLKVYDPKYKDAYKLVEELISIDPEIIKKLRNVQPTISLVNKDLIMKTNPNVPEKLAEDLTKKF